jgi:hypothetical protein
VTKKKFIKTLMGEGMSRNEAAYCAEWASIFRRPYLLVSGDLLCFFRQYFRERDIWWKALPLIARGYTDWIVYGGKIC